MAVAIRRGEKKYFEQVEHVEGIRYELVLTGHAVYLERHVSTMSQWVGGFILGLFLHVVGVIVQFVLLRSAHVSVRIPYRSLQTTSVRKMPRTMILLLGVALSILVPVVLKVLGEVMAVVGPRFTSQVFGILAVLAFFIGCVVTVIMLIRFPRTALVLGCMPREYEYHSLGEEALVHEIVERVLALQDLYLPAAPVGAGRPVEPGIAPAKPVTPLPGPQPRA